MSSRKELLSQLPDKKAARKWQRKVIHNLPEGDLFPEGPSLVTEATCNDLMQELNLSVDPATDKVSTPRGMEYAYGKGLQLAKYYLGYFKETKSEFLTQAGYWLDNNSRNLANAHALKDTMAVGMFVVLRAFHKQLGPEFLENLRDADPADLMRTFNDAGKDITQRVSLIDRVRTAVQIPEEQVFLKRLVDQMVYTSPLEIPLEDGASTMFHVVDKLWEQLKPSRTSNLTSNVPITKALPVSANRIMIPKRG